MPVAPDDLALERPARADHHGQHVARLRNAVDLDAFDEPDIAIGDGFRGILPLTANAQRRNSEADLKHVRHILPGTGLASPNVITAIAPDGSTDGLVRFRSAL